MRTVIISLLVLTVLAVAGLVGFVTWFMGNHGGPDIAFDAQVWKTVKLDGADETRHRMVNDLLRKHPLVGMTRHDVLLLLGPTGEPSFYTKEKLEYELGPERSVMPIDHAWLQIFLKDGRVVEVRVTAS